MYKIKDMVYSDAGYYLVGNNMKGYQFKGELSDFQEVPITLDDMVVENNLVKYGGIVQQYNPEDDYGKLKGDMVKRRYTMDDQMAITLNREEPDGEEHYQKMQEWREWSGRVAKAILSLNSNNSNNYEKD